MGLFKKKNKLVLNLTDEDMVRLMRIRSLYSFQLSKEVDNLFVISQAIQKEEAEIDAKYGRVLNDPVEIHEKFYKSESRQEGDDHFVDVSPTHHEPAAQAPVAPVSLDDTSELNFSELPSFFQHKSEEMKFPKEEDEEADLKE